MISVYLKPSNFCNVGCDHCYLSEEVREDPALMSESTLRQSLFFLRNFNAQNQPVHLIWHGGEPLSVSRKWFDDTNKVLQHELIGINYIESIQTSLIPYRSDWAELIHHRFNSCVGSSIDFSHRTLKGSSEAYIDLWLSKVARARLDGIYVIPGIVPSKSELSRAAEIFSFFVQNDFSTFNIDRYSPIGASPELWPTNKEISSFYVDIFNCVLHALSNNRKAPFINIVSAAVRGVLFETPGDRWGTQCQRQFLVIEPNGNLNTCPDRATFELPYSNVGHSIEHFSNSPLRRSWLRVQAGGHKRDHCMQCQFNSWCKSGCPNLPNGPQDGQEECSGYYSYLTHVKSVLTNPINRKLFIEYLGEEL